MTVDHSWDAADTGTTTCYRHPDREAPIGCSRCGRPICLDDAIDAPVGYLCPECARVPPAQRRATRALTRMDRPPATTWLTVAIAVIFLGQTVGLVSIRSFALWGPFVATGEVWRLVTGAFLHGSLIHVGFNGYLLWQLGRLLEPGVGSSRFAAIFAAGMFGGSAGALLLSWDAPTIGASGAVFGLMGAAMVGLRRRGINPWSTSIGTLVILNLVFTFLIPNVSVGGHMGGLLGGALAALPIFDEAGRTRRGATVAWLVAIGFAVLGYGIGVRGA